MWQISVYDHTCDHTTVGDALVLSTILEGVTLAKRIQDDLASLPAPSHRQLVLDAG